MGLSKTEILELEKKLIQAISASDIVFLETILHDDLLFIAPNGQVITKDMDLASHKSGEMKVEKITDTVENLQVYGDTAVIVLNYATKGKMLGTPIDGTFRYIRIWKQFTEGIKVIGGSCSKL